MQVSGSKDLVGRGPWRHKGVGFGVCQAAGSPRFLPNNGVLRRKMSWLFVFSVVSSCILLYKARTDVTERV